MLRWIEEILEGRVPEADFDSGLGRLSFICSALAYDRPFLAPLYSLAAAVRAKTSRKVDTKNLPPYVKFILLHLYERFKARRVIRCTRGRPAPGHELERFRTDAKAEGEEVVVGGFETHTAEGIPIPPLEARWFMVKLNRNNAPWAFARGEPFRAISSLEMMGSLLGIMLLLDVKEDGMCNQKGEISVSGRRTT